MLETVSLPISSTKRTERTTLRSRLAVENSMVQHLLAIDDVKDDFEGIQTTLETGRRGGVELPPT